MPLVARGRKMGGGGNGERRDTEGGGGKGRKKEGLIGYKRLNVMYGV
jgi:hypothetical protein